MSRDRDEKGRFLPGTADKQQVKQPTPADHLKKHQFQPGQSGNPAGRPKKGDAWADIIAEAMEDNAGELTGRTQDDKSTIRQAVTRRMILNALGGDVKAAQWLADRESGKPGQRLEMEITDAPSPLVLPEEQIDEIYQDNSSD